MSARKHLQTTPSQDSDSGLSMPSGTLRSSLNFTGSTPRMAEEDHERLIQSLLQRSMDSIPAQRTDFTSPYKSNANTQNMNMTFDESFLQPQRSSSPDMLSRSARMPFSQLRQTTSRSAVDPLRRSADRPLSAIGVTDGYFTAGLSSALNESQSRRTALVDKLKEAQDTLQLQSVRLTKMETDYHASSYQVEELKANESKLLRRTTELEKCNKELNELRLRDLDTQIVLQDRVKELEEALQNLATDFQLLEVDHGRRRELVDQLSTTVELIEEENRKLHKSDVEDWIIEQSINTEVESLRSEMMESKEKAIVAKKELDAQKQETARWQQESERYQNQYKMAQDTVSELKVKESSLSHKLKSQESKERELLLENDTLRCKDRELHDTVTDLKSRVAVLTCDKDRLYQEKSDFSAKIEDISQLNKRLQQEVEHLSIENRRTGNELQEKDNSLSQLTASNQQLTEQLSASQKVGERLSQELTKTKQIVDKHKDELARNKTHLQKDEETIHSLHIKSKETELQLMKLQTETEYMKESFSQEKKNLHQHIEKLQVEISNHEEQKLALEENVTRTNQKLATCQETTTHHISDLEGEVRSWKEKMDRTLGSMQHKEEQIAILSQNLSDYEAQVNSLMVEQDALQIDYDNYKHLQEENQRLSVHNRRVTQDNSEKQQVVQLLQTQRDIYARTVQEYTEKAVQAETLIEENKLQQNTVQSLRESQAEMEEEMQALRDLKTNLQKEMSSREDMMQSLKSESEKSKHDKERAEQENQMLKNAVQESFQLRQQVQSLETEMSACHADKSVISHLTEQTSKLNEKLQESTAEVTRLTKASQQLDHKLSEVEHSRSMLSEETKELHKTVTALKLSNETLDKQIQQVKEDFFHADMERKTLNSQLSEYKTRASGAEMRLEEQAEQLAKSLPMESQCRKLQQNVEELSIRCEDLTAERNSSSAQAHKLQLELQLANRSIEERLQANRQLTSDLTMLNREKENLHNELERLQKRVDEMRDTSDLQGGHWLRSANARYEQAEGSRLDTQERLRSAELDIQEWSNKYKKLSNDLLSKTDEMDTLRSTVDSLSSELQNSTNVVRHQEELISTLKEETQIIPHMTTEMREVKAGFGDLQMTNDELNNTIATLKKNAEQKEELERQLQEIGTDLIAVKNELQRTYSSMNQKELEMERLQQQYNNAMLDADNSEEKCAELKIRIDQTERAKEVALTTLQEKIHSLEAEVHSYKTEVVKLERLLRDVNGQLANTSGLAKGVSAVNQEALVSMTAERDSLLTECNSLRAQNTKLQTSQNHSDAEKRKAQLELKETKIDMFRVEKEKMNLERSNSRLDNSVSESNRLLTTLTAEYETTTSRLTEYERSIERLKRDHAYAKNELTEHVQRVECERDKLEKEVRELRVQVATLKVRLQDDGSRNAPTDVTDAILKQTNQRETSTLDVSGSNHRASTIANQLKSDIFTAPPHDTETLDPHSFSSRAPQAVGPHSVSDKISQSEVETDRSGDSWPDPLSLPELSDTISSGRRQNNTALQGKDEIDGRASNDSPFRVTEIPVTISVVNSHVYANLSPRVAALSNGAEDGVTLQEEEIDSDESHSEEEETPAVQTGHNSAPAMTRDKTMKIFKQLKKAKQRSKKCLAPTPKVTKSLPDIPKELKNRKDSFETGVAASEGAAAQGQTAPDDSVNVEHLKEDIKSKSGRVEWRGDPREPHRRYLSSWDLSIISDAEEGDSIVETESVSSEYTRSLLNVAASAEDSMQLGGRHAGSLQKSALESAGGSMDSMQSIGTIDGPSMSKTSGSSTIVGIPSLDQISLNPNSLSIDEFADSGEITPTNQEVNTTRIPVTSSPKPSPQLLTKGAKTSKKSKASSPEQRKKASKSSENKTRLPKLSLFKKKS